MFSIDHVSASLIALGALVTLGGCESEGNGRPTAEDQAWLSPVNQSVFDSSEHPDLTELSAVVAGFFLPDNRLALVERSEIHVVELSSGGARAVGRDGDGPREFRYIGLAKRVPGGILVSDVPRRRVSLISYDGGFLRSRSVLDAEFQDFFGAYPVGVRPDGRIVFRDGIAEMGRDYDGRTWNPAMYVTVRDDGEPAMFAEATGNEVYFGSRRSGDVVFGHRTFEATTADRLIIAETRRGVIAVLDWSGRDVAQIPLPAGVRVPDARTVGLQLLAEQWEQFFEALRSAAASGQVPASRANPDESPVSRADFEDWPINEVAPAIDTLLTDFDARLWARDYRLPGQDSATWRVWDIDRQELLFTARMDGEDILLDAQGELVLLRRVDELDVPRAMVTQLRAPSGES